MEQMAEFGKLDPEVQKKTMANTKMLAQNESERTKLWKEEEGLFAEAAKDCEGGLLKFDQF